jgi:hypothetical protein
MSQSEHRGPPTSERVRGRLHQETQRLRVRRARQLLHSLQQSTPAPIHRPSSPVIVVGMHRSGTSLTSRILQSLAVDMGPDASHAHHESLSFVMRNRLVLTATKADWDHPQPFVEALRDPAWTRALSLVLERTIAAPRSWLLDLHEPSPGSVDHQWGWKDPRNSLTWPLWLELYPNARFVRVRRDRNDVIASLVRRSQENLRSGSDLSIRTLTEHGVDSLCDEYAASLARLDAVAGQRVFDIDYEDLVADPTPTVSALADWLGSGPAAVATAVQLVRAPSSKR